MVALTTPPLISFLGAGLARLRRSRFFYWVMDFNPDEAIAAGWLRPDSLAARLLEWMSRFSLRQAKKGHRARPVHARPHRGQRNPPAKVVVIPPWSHDTEVKFDPEGRERFRKAHGLDGKFVVMYSGNHSPCHPLDTLLAAARQLAPDPGIVFCFVGGGSEWRKIKEEAESRKQKAEIGSSSLQPSASSLSNITCLPYQPLDQIGRVAVGRGPACGGHGQRLRWAGASMQDLQYPQCRRAGSVYRSPPKPPVGNARCASTRSIRCAAAAHGEVDRVVAAKLNGFGDSPAWPAGNRRLARARAFPRRLFCPDSSRSWNHTDLLRTHNAAPLVASATPHFLPPAFPMLASP